MKHVLLGLIAPLFFACSDPGTATETSSEYPTIFPDYTFVTLPADIAPINFGVDGATALKAKFCAPNGSELFVVSGKKHIEIPQKKWKEITHEYIGDTLHIELSVWSETHPTGIVYQPFSIAIAQDSIDPYIAYRLIDPSYEPWNHMGIYQRELATFEETNVVNNHENRMKCFNCHTFHQNSPKRFVFHERGEQGGTIIVKDGVVKKINLKNIGKKQQGVYPSWHPQGKWIMFSSNMALQSFFNRGKKVLEVYDNGSDLFLYNTDTQDILTDERMNQSESWETFPTWSPDGKMLYFCSAEPEVNIPNKYTNVKYNIVRLPFNEENGTFGAQMDTVYNVSRRGGSASHPRISADGRYLLYSEASCGTFPIWHAETELRILDLETGHELDTHILNSPETESFHSWSSNGRWILFTSRRMDGRHTRLFIAHFAKDGTIGKPFMLPQKNPEYNRLRIQSYNVPDFVKGKIYYKYNF